MATETPSIISHVSLGTNNYAAARAFYDKVMPTIGVKRVMEHEAVAAAYGKAFPEFWIQQPFDGGEANVGNGVHVCFIADSQEQVKAFYEAGIAAGATDDGPPGPRPDYGEYYYAAFLRDLDGHKIEAMHWGGPL